MASRRRSADAAKRYGPDGNGFYLRAAAPLGQTAAEVDAECPWQKQTGWPEADWLARSKYSALGGPVLDRQPRHVNEVGGVRSDEHAVRGQGVRGDQPIKVATLDTADPRENVAIDLRRLSIERKDRNDLQERIQSFFSHGGQMRMAIESALEFGEA